MSADAELSEEDDDGVREDEDEDEDEDDGITSVLEKMTQKCPVLLCLRDARRLASHRKSRQ